MGRAGREGRGRAVGAEGFPASSLGPGPSRGAPGGAEGSAVRIKGVPLGPGVSCYSPLIGASEGRLEQSAGGTGHGRAPWGIWGLARCPDGGRQQLVLTDGHRSGTAAWTDDRRDRTQGPGGMVPVGSEL